MIIIPAIDIRDGKCVRLYQGKAERETIYNDNPIAVAKEWELRGGELLHLVDLDGAFSGESKNKEIIKSILQEVKIPVQVGGGIRNIDIAKEIIEMGAKRIILGTSVIKEEKFFIDLIKRFGDKISVSVDAKDGFVCTDGWISQSHIQTVDFIKKLTKLKVKTVIYTDISKDGTLKGPNFKEIINIKKWVDVNIIASGGIGTLDDIKRLEEIGVYGVIIGRALYENRISFQEIRRN